MNTKRPSHRFANLPVPLWPNNTPNLRIIRGIHNVGNSVIILSCSAAIFASVSSIVSGRVWRDNALNPIKKAEPKN